MNAKDKDRALALEILPILQEIHQQNKEMLVRIDSIEQSATKRGAVSGAVAGGLSGSIAAVGIELIKAKFGL